jgi:hypothetical protein
LVSLNEERREFRIRRRHVSRKITSRVQSARWAEKPAFFPWDQAAESGAAPGWRLEFRQVCDWNIQVKRGCLERNMLQGEDKS